MIKILGIMAMILTLSGEPVPPHAVARLCGNTVVRTRDLNKAYAAIRTEGCERIYVEPLEGDYRLVYGIRVLHSEKEETTK